MPGSLADFPTCEGLTRLCRTDARWAGRGAFPVDCDTLQKNDSQNHLAAHSVTAMPREAADLAASFKPEPLEIPKREAYFLLTD